MSTIKERMQQYLDSKGISVRRAEIAMNQSNGSWKKSQTATTDTLENFLNAFKDVNKDWLLTGEGPMLVSDGAPSADTSHESADKRKTMYYPNVVATMGNVTFLDDPSEEHYPIFTPGYEDCGAAITAQGDSMEPLIKHGSILYIKEWRESFIAWGTIYVVCTRVGNIFVKRLYPSDNKDMVRCSSDNKDHLPFEVPRSDITHLYHVKGWTTRNTM